MFESLFSGKRVKRVTRAEAAEVYGVTPQRIDQLLRERKLRSPGFEGEHRIVEIPLEDWEAYQQRKEEGEMEEREGRYEGGPGESQTPSQADEELQREGPGEGTEGERRENGGEPGGTEGLPLFLDGQLVAYLNPDTLVSTLVALQSGGQHQVQLGEDGPAFVIGQQEGGQQEPVPGTLDPESALQALSGGGQQATGPQPGTLPVDPEALMGQSVTINLGALATVAQVLTPLLTTWIEQRGASRSDPMQQIQGLVEVLRMLREESEAMSTGAEAPEEEGGFDLTQLLVQVVQMLKGGQLSGLFGGAQAGGASPEGESGESEGQD